MNSTRIYTFKLCALAIGFSYFSYVILMYPFVGVTASVIGNNECEVIDISDFGWANYNDIQIGDIVKCHSDKKLDLTLEGQSTLTVISEHSVDVVGVDYSTLPTGITLYQLLPILYFVVIFLISLILHKKGKQSLFKNNITNIVLLFAGAYLSSWAAAREDIIGSIVCSFLIMLVPVQIIIYLETIKDKVNKNLSWKKWFLYSFIVLLTGIDSILYERGLVKSSFLIFILSLLIIYLLFYIVQNYNKFMMLIRSVRIKYFLWIICLVFVPVLLLYALPILFFENTVISEEIIVLIPLLISFVILYISFAQVFYDLDHFMKQLVKYLVYSTLFSFLVIYIIKQSNLASYQLVAVTTGILMIGLYVQNYLLPLSKNKKLARLNDSLHHLSYLVRQAKSIEEVYQYTRLELNLTLDISQVSIVTYNKNDGPESSDEYMNESEVQEIIALLDNASPHIGDLYYINSGYLLVINAGRELTMLKLSYKNNIVKMSSEEEKWVSTLAIHLNLTIESFLKASDLYAQMQEKISMVNSTTGTRLLALIGERERVKIAEDIHDSILQELIALKKLIEIYQLNGEPEQLLALNDQINLQIELIRDICFDLNPPFFNNQGLIENLQYLVHKYEKMCAITFYFDYNKELATSHTSKDTMLNFYRIFNELLNNAKKHSFANVVYVSLKKQQSKLILLYEDDGVGMNLDLDEVKNNSFGLNHIKERVKSLNGELTWSSNTNGGMSIKIVIDVSIDL